MMINRIGVKLCSDLVKFSIFCLNYDFNRCSNFVLSWVDKITTGIQIFVSAILNFVAQVTEEITQFSDQLKVTLISQLTNGISRVLQKC